MRQYIVSVCPECEGLGEWLDTPASPEPCSACGSTGNVYLPWPRLDWIDREFYLDTIGG